MVSLPEREVDRLVEERDEARRAGDYARADEIRDHLRRHGVVLEDFRHGTLWRADF
jgi:cysteinyl-tRNA synthetase